MRFFLGDAPSSRCLLHQPASSTRVTATKTHLYTFARTSLHEALLTNLFVHKFALTCLLDIDAPCYRIHVCWATFPSTHTVR